MEWHLYRRKSKLPLSRSLARFYHIKLSTDMASRYRTSFLLLATLIPATLTANNLSISNVVMTGQDQANDFVLVQFDVTWENSWRVSASQDTWDAVWIFVKYRLTPEGEWLHATLNTAGHTAPSGSTIDTPSDGKGVFLYRSAPGTGTSSFANVQLRWNYGVDGVADDAQNVDIQVIGIEMVYIPEGAFAAGSGGSGINEFSLTTIDTADAKVDPSGLGEYGGPAGGHPTGIEPDSANWPNGYSAFYIQKYEITQGQYADFLNLLTFAQANARYSGVGANRMTITKEPGPLYVASAPDRACNFLAYTDGLAYSDWAALRPMTELEFEKAARGSNLRVADEYAWGTTNLYGTSYNISNDGQPNSTVDAASATGNASYDLTDGPKEGPLRVGIFAASISTPTREEAGASYYGVMELSGNVWERAITPLNGGGQFTGIAGDGTLTEAGEFDEPSWPNCGACFGFRGGYWGSAADRLRVSDRAEAQNSENTRGYYAGFRAVRSAE